MHDLCGKYLGDNDATCPQLTCIRRKGHGGECDNTRSDPFVCGLLKVRNELVREGNLYRCLENMITFCDTIVACDDASTDGTDLVLREFFEKHNIPLSQLLFIPPDEQDFRKELAVKQRMLQRIHNIAPAWIWWQDADEVVPDPDELRRFILDVSKDPTEEGIPVLERVLRTQGGYRFPYIQLWREGFIARTDDGFADGKFVKLWRWRSDLQFDVVERTHHMQFPYNIGGIVDVDLPVIHFGNWGKNLQWKCIQYWGGLGGVGRHMNFEDATYDRLDRHWDFFPRKVTVVPDGTTTIERDQVLVTTCLPKPYTAAEKAIIEAMRDLKNLEGWFTVVIPTHNRAEYLSAAIASLRRQRYGKWIALVLDDGSTDRTPELMRRIALMDPRVFYARHPKRGAVAMNEIGMRFACEATQWWTRLGSDDYFEPDKLLLDAYALARAEWCYGPFRVLRKIVRDDLLIGSHEEWDAQELCNRPIDPRVIRRDLLDGKFHVSWANIAVRTSALRSLRVGYGNFCPPELVNMEDFVVNARLARIVGGPVFRSQRKDTGQIFIGDTDEGFNDSIVYQEQLAHDAIWRVNPIGASASTDTTTRDDQLSREIIAKENGRESDAH